MSLESRQLPTTLVAVACERRSYSHHLSTVDSLRLGTRVAERFLVSCVDPIAKIPLNLFKYIGDCDRMASRLGADVLQCDKRGDCIPPRGFRRDLPRDTTRHYEAKIKTVVVLVAALKARSLSKTNPCVSLMRLGQCHEGKTYPKLPNHSHQRGSSSLRGDDIFQSNSRNIPNCSLSHNR